MGGKHRNRKGLGIGDLVLYGAVVLLVVVILALVVGVVGSSQ